MRRSLSVGRQLHCHVISAKGRGRARRRRRRCGVVYVITIGVVMTTLPIPHPMLYLDGLQTGFSWCGGGGRRMQPRIRSSRDIPMSGVYAYNGYMAAAPAARKQCCPPIGGRDRSHQGPFYASSQKRHCSGSTKSMLFSREHHNIYNFYNHRIL